MITSDSALSSPWFEPEALLFDLDGVIVDVSESYRAAIIATCQSYQVTVTHTQISDLKAQGDANNDWIVTQRLLEHHQVSRTLDEITERFETYYQGAGDQLGLKVRERMIPTRADLEALLESRVAAAVTGRPRRDADEVLERFGLCDLFPVVVTMDDAPRKPDPAPVRLALQQLGVQRAWMMGDTIDDIHAAQAAGVLPIGVIAPHEDPEIITAQLTASGAVRVVAQLRELLEVLP